MAARQLRGASARVVSSGRLCEVRSLSGGDRGWRGGSWRLAVAVQWFLAVGWCCCVDNR